MNPGGAWPVCLMAALQEEIMLKVGGRESPSVLRTAFSKGLQ